MFLFQFEKKEPGFVITSFNSKPTPDGNSRFCTGLQFNSKEDARKYVESVADIQRARSAHIKNTDSIGGRLSAENLTKKSMDDLERKFNGKCQRVVFDIPFGKEPGIKDRVYTAKEVSNIDYQDGIGARSGKLPSRIA